MSLFLSIMMGGLGLRFGRLGASVRSGGGGGAPPGDPPEMRFNSATNSQLLAVLEDF